MIKDWRKLTSSRPLPRPRFEEYDKMEEYPYVSSALMVYTQETLQVNPDTGRIYEVEVLKGDEQSILKKIADIEDIFLNYLNFIVYNTYKYGEFVVLIEGDKNSPKLTFIHPSSYELDEEGNVYPKQGKIRQEKLDENTYQRFALLTDYRDFPYGTSLIKKVRRLWLRLKLLEDSLTLYRLARATSRYVFYVYTGDLSPEEAFRYINQIKDQVKKNKLIDPRTGDLSSEINFWDVHDDLWIPVGSDERRVQVDVLSGGANVTDIADMEYFLSQFFGALQIPKAYIGNEYDVNRATLVMQDQRFARVIKNYQPYFAKSIAGFLEKVLKAWYNMDAVLRVKMYFPNIDDMMRLDYLTQKAQLLQVLASIELPDGKPLVSPEMIRKMWEEGVSMALSQGIEKEGTPPEELSKEIQNLLNKESENA
jgi:hypothetical protein